MSVFQLVVYRLSEVQSQLLKGLEKITKKSKLTLSRLVSAVQNLHSTGKIPAAPRRLKVTGVHSVDE